MNNHDQPVQPQPAVARRLRKVLIANRGEVAVRVIRACRELGIASVAVYSDADRHAMHVALADESFYLGGSRAVESYLNPQRLLEAVAATGADAVHPGFGFLAENADFAEAVRRAGVEFIGPSADAIRLMGSKDRARRLARELGIPVIPGEEDAELSPRGLAAAADRIGYPVMLKAVAGGGGTGIRVVRRPEDLAAEIVSARQEAAAAFGDPTLLIERYFERVRHIEVQLVADLHGSVVHCFDRECSVQRRRQKVIEEAPAPRLNPALREQLLDAATRIARAVGYSSLGTVEFLVDDEAGEFFFLEMNTRLQVEHAITEMVTGIDLVQWQIEIAEGRPLRRRQEDICCSGHAVECRLYAEDPEAAFAPAAGTVLHWSVEGGPHTRVDTSVCTGTEVSPYYDPMLAKLIAWGPDRDAACRNVSQLLSRTVALGVPTNQRFLARVLSHPGFRQAMTSTRFIELHQSGLTTPPEPAVSRRALLIAALQRWRLQSGGANDGLRERSYRGRAGAFEATVRIRRQEDGRYLAAVDGQAFDIDVLHDEGQVMVVAIDGHALRHVTVARNDTAWVSMPGAGAIRVDFQSRFLNRPAADVAGCYRAAMTGRILEVLVERGSLVRAGDKLLTMESMKMEHTTVAGSNGVVSQLWAAPGVVVEKGALLIEIDESAAAGELLGQGA
jgi:acetyl-CoA carboxylase biotin carboxylase subunit